MKRRKEIEQEVMKTLESLDDVEDIEVSPYFAARVQAKIREADRQQARSLKQWFRTPRLRLAGVIVLLVLNLVSFITLFPTSQTQPQLEERQAYLSAFAEEYGLAQDETTLLESEEVLYELFQ
ncbi:hypothetical protein GF339_01800 [candidate division KSB3 bacterium]|uniref:Uncharacterized protein n=1 Tax=candidate division KSB3 bacterium TaxID=2044937 RepID=A0A9D5JS86_9BACT|nr:hypothetical protein [candidate division KSB3 bacterium]MBD3323285.1 hypothetical protein [candidate division KSB3 bacterium]